MLLLLAPEGFWRTRERQAGVAGEREEKKERGYLLLLRALQRAQAERRLKLKVNLNFAVQLVR